ncbi:glycerophosphodiester phosphodiesterase [Arthrobacter sp.]|uniref:glycerophosphodiester phosphodiesterase n=1 Tax=Arthrobacter sp. TaxID=1667 RepID=UPI00258A1774|nr:glycerophosphodiester phosphodiesterase [Arthrobacter sp.]
MSPREEAGFGRRRFLQLAMIGATGLLTACSASAVVPPGVTPTPTRTTTTLDELLAQDVFAIAHRGSGDTWPEHTLRAYTEAVAAGAMAVEVSVHMTKDGVLVCHHDTNLSRMTGVDRDIKDLTFEELAVIRNDARAWLGPATPLEPIPAFRDVLDALARRTVLFIEDKTGEHAKEVLDLMDFYPGSTSHMVWKQTAASGSYKEARRRGYTLWGYFMDDADHQFDRYQDRFDLLGIYHGATDQAMRDLVAFGKPVICWEIHTRAMRRRVLALGVRGLMCSNYPYVTASTALAVKDDFGTGRRATGDLPWILTPKYQPRFDEPSRGLDFAFASAATYVLGSLGPLAAPSYGCTFSLCWPEELPAPDDGAGLALALAQDDPALVSGPAAAAYLAQLSPHGKLTLLLRQGSTDSDRVLASVQTAPLKRGEWATLRLEATPSGISLSRDSDPAWKTTAQDGGQHGGYLALVKGYRTPQTVRFRDVAVLATS